MQTLNMWSNLGNFWPAPCVDPAYADLAVGHSYSVWVFNGADEDITAGTIEFWAADALPDNPCAPGEFEPIDPVAGCTAIVSGVPEQGPVTVTITPEMPIKARSLCGFAAPCPGQFLQIRGLPAGATAVCVIGNLKRTNFDHMSEWGFIPPPMQLGSPIVAGQRPALPPASPQPQTQTHHRAQRRTQETESREPAR